MGDCGSLVASSILAYRFPAAGPSSPRFSAAARRKIYEGQRHDAFVAEPTSIRGILDTLNAIGLYDVVLPFLIVFTLMFALLQKTRILGTVDGEPNKRLNFMLAFLLALLCVALLANILGRLFSLHP